LSNELSTDTIIEYSKNHFMKDFANKIACADGSG
jgi:hypothetical protein